MELITSLTSDQQRLLPLRSEQCLTAVWSTASSDVDRAEAGVRDLYRASDLAEPRYILWYSSPLVGLAAVGALRAVNWIKYYETGLLFGDLLTSSAEEVPDQTMSGLDRFIQRRWCLLAPDGSEPDFSSVLDPQLGDQVHRDNYEHLRYQVAQRMFDQSPDVLQAVLEPLWRPLQDRIWNDPELWPYRGSWEAYRLGLFAYFAEIGVQFSRGPALKARNEIARSAGWWWPYKAVCVITDRPTMLKLDQENRLHSNNGPALKYADGYSFHVQYGGTEPWRDRGMFDT